VKKLKCGLCGSKDIEVTEGTGYMFYRCVPCRYYWQVLKRDA
jgi:hypothetical protein